MHYFTDPLLRAPTIASMLICLTTALIGVLVFLRKESLLGESLSHATYPGVGLGLLFSSLFISSESSFMSVFVLLFAGVTSLFALFCIRVLQKRLRVPADASLGLVLALFFGIGVTIASRMQFTHTTLYRQGQLYLYGQTATMTDEHILIYAVLLLVVALTVFLFYKELLTLTMDPQFADTIGMKTSLLNGIVAFLTVGAIIIGIRSVGVVLVSAMLIAPAASARALTQSFKQMLLIASLLGALAALIGTILSLELSYTLYALFPEEKPSIPAGPMIVLVSGGISLLCFAFSPTTGLVTRAIRSFKFRTKRREENCLKAIWKKGGTVKTSDLIDFGTHRQIFRVMRLLKREGWVKPLGHGEYKLTSDGTKRAKHIVRLHRLWELYLVEYLGIGKERVHCSAAEIEHILTPDVERQLNTLLHNPKLDPHHQPIPSGDLL